jgi:hypothetical protein
VKLICIEDTLRKIHCMSVPCSVNGAVMTGCKLAGKHFDVSKINFAILLLQ